MSNKKDLSGQRFGRLIAIEEATPMRSPNGHKLRRWLCRCDCGKEKIIRQSSLTAGLSTSCGCSRRKDLSGQRFGRLVVISENETPYISQQGVSVRRWNCRCDCGKEVTVRQSDLSYKRSCGCESYQNRKPRHDLTGRRFGHLLVIGRARLNAKSNTNGWLCRCDCGKEKVYLTSNLLRGDVTSCGCEAPKAAATRSRKEGRNVFGFYDGTSITAIKPGRGPNKNSSSGYRGVCFNKWSNRWVSQICFRRKIIFLGAFADVNDAIAARKAAEEKYFAPVIAAYEEEKRKDEKK